MANFSTEFSIDSKNTVEDVVRLACKWIAGSPHSKVGKANLNDIPLDGERVIKEGFETVTIATARQSEYEIGGLRYVRTEHGLEWTSSIVSLKTAERTQLSIQVVCEALNTAVKLPPAKKPYFIRQAIEVLGGGSDGEVPIADQPFRLNEDEAHVAAALILGSAGNRLPIIYVSASFDGGYQIDADEMARFVSGMAHVIVEPSRAFSFKVKNLTGARNVYGGTVGVYWPDSVARKSYFLDQDVLDARALQVEIAKDIRAALSNRRLRSQCTWAHLQETIAGKRFERIKAEGSQEVKEFVDVFGAELAAKDVRIREAEDDIARLSADLRRYANQTGGFGSGLLRPCAEQDLYEHEIVDIVIDALADAMRTSKENSRRQHVLAALIAANPHSGSRQRMADEVKGLFRTYRDMDARVRSALARLGFDLSEDGKHYKAVFQGDGRYTFTLPKTSSDHRAGKNITSDINSTLF